MDESLLGGIDDGPADGARHSFIVANAAPTLFRSITGAMAVAESIVAYTVARGGETGLASLARMEADLHRMGVYWQGAESQRMRT